MKIKSIVLLILVGILGLGLTSCAPGDAEFLQAMAEEWANAKDVNPTDKDGKINWGGVINGGLSAAGLPGGDDDVKAVIDAKGVVDNIRKADQAAEQAQQSLKNGDAKKAVNLLDPVIKDRPNDWWLYDQRGVANIEAGYPEAGSNDFNSARANGKRVQVADHQRQLLFESIARQRAGGGQARCLTYIAMANTYNDLLNSGTGDADFYRTQMNANRQAANEPGVTCK